MLILLLTIWSGYSLGGCDINISQSELNFATFTPQKTDQIQNGYRKINEPQQLTLTVNCDPSEPAQAIALSFSGMPADNQLYSLTSSEGSIGVYQLTLHNVTLDGKSVMLQATDETNSNSAAVFSNHRKLQPVINGIVTKGHQLTGQVTAQIWADDKRALPHSGETWSGNGRFSWY
ncbi:MULTISPECIES: fimbrial protein [Yersinia]|nr:MULTISPECIES: fimbrial protein [Yersinia]MCB5309657.1 fimbrial protein [Yersinia massiliensis]